MTHRLGAPSVSIGIAAVGLLEGEQLSTPSLGGDARSLGGHLVGRGIGQVAHDLPADRGIGESSSQSMTFMGIWLGLESVELPATVR